MTKIVVLDGQTCNPGDLSWAPLQALGKVDLYDKSTPEQVVPRSRGATVVINNKMIIADAVMAQLPDLRCIALTSTGTDVVDSAAARRRGIVVCNVPAYSTASVAQLTFALILELAQQVGLHAAAVRDGEWCRAPNFCFWKTTQIELTGMTIGLIGYGSIGRAVAAIASAFGMRVIAASRTRPSGLADGVTWLAGNDDVFRQADIVSLHCPLTPSTERLVNQRTLALMKPGAFLINTGRGRLLDEHAVATALNEGHLGGFGADVLSSEPPASDNPLLTARNAFITPHLAWATRTARQRLLDATVANTAAFLNGTPQNVVNCGSSAVPLKRSYS